MAFVCVAIILEHCQKLEARTATLILVGSGAEMNDYRKSERKL